MLNLGDDLDRDILTAAGVNPDLVQQGTLTIDFMPQSGPTTIRYTMVGAVDATELKQLIAAAVAPD